MNEQDRILWKYLDPNKGNPMRHDWVGEKIGDAVCSKCGSKYKEGECTISHPYPGTEADIAEKIRVWMEKADKGEVYRKSLCDILQAGDEPIMTSTFVDWLILHCTPADKINAFCKLMGKG